MRPDVEDFFSLKLLTNLTDYEWSIQLEFLFGHPYVWL